MPTDYPYDQPLPTDPELYGYEDDPQIPPKPPADEPPSDAPEDNPPPPPGNTPPDPWATAPTDGNWQAWFLKNVQGLAATPESLAGLEAKLTPHGIKVLKNAAGIAGKIQLPDGKIIDVGRAFSSGNPSQMGWQWLEGDGAASADGTPIEIDPSYLVPFEEQFATPENAAMLPDFAYADFQAPDDFSYDPFHAPDANAMFQDPGYQFRLDQGRRALETSAAAKGLLNSGGTLNDLITYGQSLGSQEYSNVYGRARDTWGMNRDNAFGNWSANYEKDLGTWGANRDKEFGVRGLNVTNRNEAYQRAWNEFIGRRDQFYMNQDRPFQKLVTSAGIGAGAAAS